MDSDLKDVIYLFYTFYFIYLSWWLAVNTSPYKVTFKLGKKTKDKT